MGVTIKGTFPSRREVEIAVEHLVQDHGIERTDVFIEPAGEENSAGVEPAGADVESGHAGIDPDTEGAAYTGALIVAVDMNEHGAAVVEKAFRDAGAVEVVTS